MSPRWWLTRRTGVSYTEGVLRRSFLAFAALALVLGLAACGGVADPLSPANPLALAASRSADAGGVKMHMDAKFTVAGQSASLSADGVFDGDEGELTTNVGDLLGQAGIPGDGELKVIVAKDGDHPVLYVRMPDLAAMLPGGKPWIKVDRRAGGVDGGRRQGQGHPRRDGPEPGRRPRAAAQGRQRHRGRHRDDRRRADDALPRHGRRRRGARERGRARRGSRRGARERHRDEGSGRRVGRRRRLRPQAARRLQHRPPAARASAAS